MQITINETECVTMAKAAEMLRCGYSRVAWLVSRGYLRAISLPGESRKFVTVESIADLEVPPPGRRPKAKT